MSLDEELLKIMEKREGSILVVDDRCNLKFGDIALDHVDNERAIEKFAEQQLGIDCGGSTFIRDFSHNKISDDNDIYNIYKNHLPDPSVILVNANLSSFPSLKEIITPYLTTKKLKEDFPNSEVILYLPKFNDGVINRAFDASLNLIGLNLGLDLENVEIEKVNQNNFPTLMHFLCYKMTGKMFGRTSERSLSSLQHEYKNNMWDSYLPFIDQSLNAGNMQSRMDYNFLVLSDREKILLGEFSPATAHKVLVQDLEEDLDFKCLESCSAIFIDNAWDSKFPGALGKGIERLRKLKQELGNRRIPIIYQSGHPLDAFSREEREELNDLGAVLATKDLFPKVCRGRDAAEKEHQVSKIAERNPSLGKYLSQVYDFNSGQVVGNDDLFIVCSKIVTENEINDLEKSDLFAKLNIEEDDYSHRMYVLSMLHTELKSELDNPVFKPTVKKFFSFSTLEKELGEEVKPFERVYTNITKNKEHYQKRTIAHNDAKEDNWFQGRVLGDSSNAAPGTEYKDLARALLDESNGFELAQDVSQVTNYVDNYILLRENVDSDFVVNKEQFKKRVYETMLTESLRLAKFRNKCWKKENTVPGYLAVAKTYLDLLQ
jgi:hypothetical protein